MLLYEVMELPASEIEFWKAYYSFVPFPQEREDERIAIQTYAIVSTLLNIGGMKTQTPVTVEMFMPDYWGERNLAEMSEKKLIDQEKKFVGNLLASGLGKMEHGT